MQRHVGFFLFVICIGAIITAGCTSTGSSNATAQITSVPTTAVPTTAISNPVLPTPTASVITTIASATQTTVSNINKTPQLPSDYTDVSKIQFSHYSDNNFSLDYPSAWTVSEYTFNDFINDPVFGYGPNQTLLNASVNQIMFYADVSAGAGSGNSGQPQVGRNIMFKSSDGKMELIVFTNDVSGTQTGNYILNSNPEWADTEAGELSPDLMGSQVGGYKYGMSGNTMYSEFTFTSPKSSAEYPLAYISKNFVTLHHVYRFILFSNDPNFQNYNNFQDRIFSSITTNDLPS
jgi:hypothetical protein